MKNRHFILGCLCLLVTCSLIRQSAACGPGRSGGRRRNARKMTPLVFKQYSPNLNENTMIASGPPEGRITRNDPRYKDLVPNYNPDILFRDVEGTGASRLMTQVQTSLLPRDSRIRKSEDSNCVPTRIGLAFRADESALMIRTSPGPFHPGSREVSKVRAFSLFLFLSLFPLNRLAYKNSLLFIS